MPFERRTRAILRTAEFGFLGVLVVTLVHTPLLNGEAKNTGRFSMELKVRVKATDLDLRVNFFLFLFVS